MASPSPPFFFPGRDEADESAGACWRDNFWEVALGMLASVVESGESEGEDEDEDEALMKLG